MSWEGITAIIALLVSVIGAAYSIGFLGGTVSAHDKEIDRARDRVDELERVIRDMIRRDHND